MDRGAWWTTVHGVTKSRTQLSIIIHYIKSSFFFLISSKHCNSIEFILEILKQMCWFGLNWHRIYLHWVEIGSICLDQLIFKIDKEIQK